MSRQGDLHATADPPAARMLVDGHVGGRTEEDQRAFAPFDANLLRSTHTSPAIAQIMRSERGAKQ
jgi:hypothetical protein